MIKIIVNKGEDVIAKVSTVLQEQGVENGAIVSVVGAVESATISNMDAQDSSKDFLNKYTEQLELSGTGEVADGVPHIHCIASRKGEQTLAGHLHKAVVGDWFVHVYVAEM